MAYNHCQQLSSIGGPVTVGTARSSRRLISAMLAATTLLAASAALLACSAAKAADAPPATLTGPGAALLAGREAYRAGDPQAKKVVEKLNEAAEKDLSVGPLSVMNKKAVAPNGDKHEYMSLSPYWWPDPSKPDGKPYIRRDGEYNPERADYDLDALDKLSETVGELSLAYYVTGDEKYAKKCAEMIRTWCVDPATKMNPSLKYGQFVPGLDIIRPSGIIEGGRFRKVCDAVTLIQGSPSWSAEDDKVTREFFKGMLTYVTTSSQGMEELNQPNNHGTWAHVQTATYALFLGETAKAKELLDGPFKARIGSQISADGSMPEEMARTRSFHYTRFNSLALIEMASLGDRIGLDLWNYKTADGRSLRTTLDFMIPYTLKEKPWPKKDIEDTRYGDMVEVLRRAANAYHEPKYEAVVKKLREEDSRDLVDFRFPAVK